MTIALAGNPNCGKTTLFNALTGENQHVGNWPGVTVERRKGTLAEDAAVQVIDLPGVYSLSPYTPEERIARDALLTDKPDVIINIVDATAIERSLYLTLQLMQLDIPMVIALNMMDEVAKRGDSISLSLMVARLGVPVIPICARKQQGMDALLLRVRRQATRPSFSLGDPALEQLRKLIQPYANHAHLPADYIADKLMERDELVLRRLMLPVNIAAKVRDIISEAEQRTGMEAMAMMASLRYAHIEGLLDGVVRRKSQQVSITDRIDGLLCHPVLALPCFIGSMLLVFLVPFGPVGSWISVMLSTLLAQLTEVISRGLTTLGASLWLHDLVVDGLLTGVSSVVSLLPVVLLLFLCLTILEDSGYMARVACMMDRPLRGVGLNGRSFIPLLMGFGCTVPAVMACRCIASPRERRHTMLLTAFMSCGAKTAVYGVLLHAFMGQKTALPMACIYLTGILLMCIVGRFLRGSEAGDSSFVMELPEYRLPSMGNVLRTMRDRAGDFLSRAFTVILLSTVAVWFLSSYTMALRPADTVEGSILGSFASLLRPVFQPLGFGDTAPIAGLLTGLLVKENIISTMAVVIGESGLAGVFADQSAAIAYIVFVLLYSPCVAALSAMKQEGGWRLMMRCAVGQSVLAWVCSFVAYRLL